MSSNFEVTGDRVWSSERLAALKVMWVDERKSGSECAAAFGVSRCAIIGVVYRNQFVRPWAEPKGEPKRKRIKVKDRPVSGRTILARAAVAAIMAEERVAVELPPEVIDTTMVSINDLGPRSCRWISGPVRIDERIYCGAPTPIGKPWCEHHHGIAYNRVPQTFRPQMRV